jgi:catechol 2,3-dioxygenase-like lactoylglutathione lyase family enzyme
MDAVAVDHPTLTIPADGVETAVDFYTDLGFSIEGRDRYESGERPILAVRLTPDSVIHLRPSEGFEPPSGDAFDHVAIRVDADVDAIRETLTAAGAEIERELVPLGATGEAPAVYARDPFGYLLELKVDG